MTLARLKTRLQEAKRAAYEAERKEKRAAVAAASLKEYINQAEYKPSDELYKEYQWACTVRDELKAASLEAKKAVDEAQWYVHLVAARETAMFDGNDEI